MSYKVSPFETPPLLRRPKTTNNQSMSLNRKRQLLLEQLEDSQSNNNNTSSSNNNTNFKNVLIPSPPRPSTALTNTNNSNNSNNNSQAQKRLIQQQLDELPEWLGPGTKGIAERKREAKAGTGKQFALFTRQHDATQSASHNIKSMNGEHHRIHDDGGDVSDDESNNDAPSAATLAWREWAKKKDEQKKLKRMEEEKLAREHQFNNISATSPRSPSRHNLYTIGAKTSEKKDKNNKQSGDEHDEGQDGVHGRDDTNISMLRDRSQARHVSAFNLASARRAEERQSWMRVRFAKHEKREQVLEEREKEELMIRNHLKQQTQDREAYLNACFVERNNQISNARTQVAETIIRDNMLNVSEEQMESFTRSVDPRRVLEQLRKDRPTSSSSPSTMVVVANSSSRSPPSSSSPARQNQQKPQTSAELADEQRRLRRGDEDALRAARLEDLSARRQLHDNVIVDVAAGQRLKHDTANMRLANIQDQSVVDRKRWEGLFDEQAVSRQERIQHLAEERKDQVERRCARNRELYEAVAANHDKMVQDKQRALSKRRAVMDTTGPFYEEKRQQAERIRREVASAPRLNRRELEDEKHFVAAKMKEAFDEKRRHYEEEVRRELQVKREEADRARRNRFMSNSAGAATSPSKARPGTASNGLNSMSNSNNNNNNNQHNHLKHQHATMVDEWSASW